MSQHFSATHMHILWGRRASETKWGKGKRNEKGSGIAGHCASHRYVHCPLIHPSQWNTANLTDWPERWSGRASSSCESNRILFVLITKSCRFYFCFTMKEKRIIEKLLYCWLQPTTTMTVAAVATHLIFNKWIFCVHHFVSAEKFILFAYHSNYLQKWTQSTALEV